MNDASFFTHPNADWQRRYEALRAAIVERLPDRLVAERFGYSPGYISQLRFQFRHGRIDFSEPTAEGKALSAYAQAKVGHFASLRSNKSRPVKMHKGKMKNIFAGARPSNMIENQQSIITRSWMPSGSAAGGLSN